MRHVQGVTDLLDGVAAADWTPKGWGGELLLCNQPLANGGYGGYCGKKLLLLPGRRLSWHYHRVKDEWFYLESGRVALLFRPNHADEPDDINRACVVELRPGDRFHVEPYTRHQLIGLETSWVIETSTLHRDEDSVRVIRGD